MRSLRLAFLPALPVFAGILALELAYGADLGDALLYVAYEVGFLVVPGWLVYRALTREPRGALPQLALGWALGYVLEILAFMFTAATGTRSLFVLYPILFVAIALGVILRRSPPSDPPQVSGDPPSGQLSWLIAAVCLVVVAYVGITFFSATPLPGGKAVHYHQDVPWSLSIAGEAKNHWPIEDPNVSGEPFPYHYFVHVHLAAVSQATGIALPTVFLRLFLLPMITLIVLQVVAAGQVLLRSVGVGIGAVCLVFLVGQVNLNHDAPFASLQFLGVLFTYLVGSPSFVIGLVIFLPIVILLGTLVRNQGSDPPIGTWALLLLFFIGASDAKIVLLPLVLGSLVLFSGWMWITERKAPTAVFPAAALAFAVGAAVYYLQYRGHRSGLIVDLGAGITLFTETMPAVAGVRDYVSGLLPSFPGSGAAISAGGIVFGVFGLFGAQLLGIVWLLARRGVRLQREHAWLLSLLTAGIGSILVLDSPGSGNVLYFLPYGMAAGCMVAADGLRLAWLNRPRLSGRAARVVALLAGGVIILLGALLIPEHYQSPLEPVSIGRTYILSYGGLIIGLVLLLVAARLWVRPWAWIGAATVSVTIILAGALDTPLEQVEPALRSRVTPNSGKRLTPGLYEALTWIRDSTPTGSVIATNNLEAFEFDPAAFSERSVFLGGWGYSVRTREVRWTGASSAPLTGVGGTAGVNLYADRLRLNEAVFSSGSPAAARILRDRFGVRYLLVDNVNGAPANVPGLRRISRPVYRSPGALVLELG